jgi:CheY-like chemotaxis protein
MALTALVVCSDAEGVQVLSAILADRGIGVERCADSTVAAARLADQRYAAAIIDCEDEAAAIELIAAARTASANETTLIVAIVDARNETRELFAKGANFLLYKPISAERAKDSLQAAWSLMPRERRRKQRAHVSTQASITFATTEDAAAPLLNLSEDGVALHSQSLMPPPCRVYFQFKLPGQSSLVRLAGEVVWQDSRGRAGLHFAHVPQASRRVLDEWLRSNLAQPDEPREATPITLDQFGATTPAANPAAATPPTSVSERRGQSRQTCRLGVNVYRPSGDILQHCMLTDMSAGGCYVETTQPLSVGTAVVIEVRTTEWKIRVRGKVRSMHRGYGMGIAFSPRTAEEREQVRLLMACQESRFAAGIGVPIEQG